MLGRQRVERQVGEAEHADQQVVEVVGDAAGQEPQALDPLGVLQAALGLQPLVLGPHPLADVDEEQGEAAAGLRGGEDVEGAVDLGAVALEARALAAQGDPPEDLDPARIDVGKDLAHPASQHLFAALADQPLEGRVDLQVAPVAGTSGIVDDDLRQHESLQHGLEEKLEMGRLELRSPTLLAQHLGPRPGACKLRLGAFRRVLAGHRGGSGGRAVGRQRWRQFLRSRW